MAGISRKVGWRARAKSNGPIGSPCNTPDSKDNMTCPEKRWLTKIAILLFENFPLIRKFATTLKKLFRVLKFDSNFKGTRKNTIVEENMDVLDPGLSLPGDFLR